MIDQKYAPYAALILRLGLGTMWMSHALLKYVVFTIPGFAGFLGSVGMPGFMAWPVFIMEFGGGLMILTGLYSRLASLLLIPVMAGAMWVHLGNGWVFSSPNGGWEYPAFLILVSVVHILLGEGALSLKRSPNISGLRFSVAK